MTVIAENDSRSESRWQMWSTDVHLVVTDPMSIEAAESIVRTELDAVDHACSRFRPDSEIMNLTGSHVRPAPVSAVLADLVLASLHAADITDGAVDPTLGSAMIDLGYDRDFSLLEPPTGGYSATVSVVRRADWTMVTLHDGMLTVPEGVVLDLGATAKALAADRCAALVASELGCGVLVSIGGDISTSGPSPSTGWQIRVADGDNQPSTTITIGSGVGVATSSTLRRRWSKGGKTAHHILDPQLLVPVEPHWRTVTVVAQSCFLANTASTAAVVKGSAAVRWLRDIGLPARMIDAGGDTTLTPGWPENSSHSGLPNTEED